MTAIKKLTTYNRLKVLAAHDLRGAALRFVPIQICLLLFKVVQELALYGRLYTAWHLMAIEVFMVSVPFVAFALWLLSRLDTIQIKLLKIATYDSLTGLRNRRAFFEESKEVLRSDGGVLLMIDVDHPKRINDTYGHAIGDLCLQELSRNLTEALDPEDILARIGGEEFAALLTGASLSEAEALGNQLALGFDFSVPGTAVYQNVTVSIGAAKVEIRDEIDVVLRLADEALYQAKNAGRATHDRE